MAQTLKFTVEVAADRATEALKAVSVAMNQAGIEIRAKLLGIGTAASGAGKEIQGLTGKVKEYVSEQRAQGRIAGFFVREIADIVPVSDSAKNALSGLIGAFAGGFGAGMAIDLAITTTKLVVEQFRATTEEAKRAADAVRKLNDEIASEQARVSSLQSTRRGDAFGAAASTGQDSIRKASAEFAEANRKYQEAFADVRSEDLMAGATSPAVVRLQQMELEAQKAEEKLRVAVLEADKAWTAGAVADSDVRRAKLEQEKAALEEIIKIRTEDAQWRARAGEAYGKSEDANLLYGGDPNAMREAMKYAHRPDTSGAASVGGFYSLEAAGYDEKEIARQREQMRQDEERALQQSIATYERWGTAVGDVFGSVATGQMSITQGFQAMEKLILQSVLQMAVKEITANAMVAGSESAKTGALAGPAGAAAMASATIAVVMALLGNLPSAAGGWKVPYDTLAMVHEDERILPARYSKGLDRLVENGGSGPTMNFYATYMDRAGSRQLASDVTREQRKIARRRRS